MSEQKIIFRPRQCGKTFEFHYDRYYDEKEKAELRNQSGQWFLDRGFIGLDGKDIRTDFK